MSEIKKYDIDGEVFADWPMLMKKEVIVDRVCKVMELYANTMEKSGNVLFPIALGIARAQADTILSQQIFPRGSKGENLYVNSEADNE